MPPKPLALVFAAYFGITGAMAIVGGVMIQSGSLLTAGIALVLASMIVTS